MNEEILSRLDALALKLNTTVELLWSALVTDHVHKSLTLAIGFGVLAIISLVICSKCREGAEREKSVSICGFIFGAFAGITTTIACLVNAADAASPSISVMKTFADILK